MKIAHLIIQAIIIIASIAILMTLAGVFGIQIPRWIITILWIVLAAIVGITAIKYLMSKNV